ncbi:MAG: peptidoglycan recognition protein family protein [Treponema sp.]|nr:peptidoglycan recognition protein family protein [Treponema sp.]
MEIMEQYLSINKYSRPGKKLSECRAIILHWVGKPMQKAIDVWKWFEHECPDAQHYSSAHYIIDLDGKVMHAVPDDEVAYHCGSTKPDLKSGLIYTDWAREKFGRYVQDPERNSPNNCTIGIELCVIDWQGNFRNETIDAAIKLTSLLLEQKHLCCDDIGTHAKVTGWKDCPKLWYDHPELFDKFKQKVMAISKVQGKA